MVALADLGMAAAPHTLPVVPLSRQADKPSSYATQRSVRHSMATRDEARSFPFHKLTPELMLLLLDHLDELDHKSILQLRLVSKSFENATFKVAFRKLTVDEKLLEAASEPSDMTSLRQLLSCTRHIHLRSNLNKALVIKILSYTTNLRSIHWMYVSDAKTWFPNEVFNPEYLESNNIKVHVKDLPLLQPPILGSPEDYFELLPSRQLGSLSLALPMPPLISRLDPLRWLLVKASNLESFHYHDRGQGTSFWFEKGERLPAYKHLTLQSYNWTHSAQEVQEHWQMHNLQSLGLIDVPIANFLRSINATDLNKLQSIQFDDKPSYLDENSEEQRRDATKLMQNLMTNVIEALESVKITCNMDLFDIESLLCHADTLRNLRLRDHIGFEDDYVRCPCLHPRQIVMMAEKLNDLETLEVDMDMTLSDPVEFLRGVVQFRSLRDLELHVQTVISPDEDVFDNRDRDFDAALSALRLLAQDREARGLEPLRKMTVNVGGWRPILVRRLSATWKKKNALGIFAERCFVFEKKDMGVLYGFREEVCHEALGHCPNVPAALECEGLWNVF